MATASSRPTSGVTPSTKWSLYAGAYTFLLSVGLLVVLSPVSRTLGAILRFPPGYSAFLLSGPVTCIGASAWWALVEWRGAYRYRTGGFFGVVTALTSVLFWLLVVTAIFGSLVVMGLTVVGFVLVVTLPVAFLAGISLMYARQRAG